MRLGNSVQSWGLVVRILHWLVAAFLVCQLITDWLSENASNRETSDTLIRTHFQFGVILTALIVMRVFWRLSHKPPDPLPGEPVWRERTAKTVHGLIYLLLLALPIAGYIVFVHMQLAMDVFGLFTVPTLFAPQYEGEVLRAGAWYVHRYAGWLLVGLVVLHVMAALFHQFALNDSLLQRMALKLRRS